MGKEISAGAIIFKRNDRIKYLLLFREGHDKYKPLWGFARGKIEEDEDEMSTVKREIEEETGLKKLKYLKFREKISWFFRRDGETIFKESIFYLAENVNEEVKISDEHDDFKWCSFDEAMKLLKFKNAKEVLTKADEFLKGSLTNFI